MENLPPKTCPVCKKEFTPTRQWQKYCTNKCQQNNFNLKRNDFLGNLTTKNIQLESENKQLKSTVESLKSEVESLKSEIKKLTAENKALKSSFDTMTFRYLNKK